MTAQVLHMITFTWQPDAESGAIEEFHRRIIDFAAACDGVISFHAGPDAGLMPDNADYGIVALFADRDHFEQYRSAPEHLRIIEGSLMPIVDGRSRLQLSPALTPGVTDGAGTGS